MFPTTPLLFRDYFARLEHLRSNLIALSHALKVGFKTPKSFIELTVSQPIVKYNDLSC